MKVEYLRRVQKVLETNLNSSNIMKRINTWAISLRRYSASFIDRNCTELTKLDRRTRKLMTMHHALHPKSNVDHLCIPRKEGGTEPQSVKEYYFFMLLFYNSLVEKTNFPNTAAFQSCFSLL